MRDTVTDGNGKIKLAREDLHQLVWTTPMSKLCKEYGLSDNGLRKICDRHQIPTPGTGYWAKLQHGKPVRKTPLSVCDGQDQRVVIHVAPQDTSSPTPKEVFDPDIMMLLDCARNLPKVVVPETLRSRHRLVSVTKTALQQATPDQYGLVSPRRGDSEHALDIRVSKGSIPRTLRFYDAFIKAVENVGGSVRVEGCKWEHKTIVYFGDEAAGTVRVRERYTQKRKTPGEKRKYSWHEYNYSPTGMLLLDAGPSSYESPRCEDSVKRRRIEDCINGVLIQLVEKLGRDRIQAREWEERRRREEEAQRLRDELEEQRRREEARRNQLVSDAERWRTARLVRDYVAAACDELVGNDDGIDPKSELGEWMRWAEEHADRLDPLVAAGS